MSKFCGVILDLPRRKRSAVEWEPPIKFYDLEILVDWLADETTYLCEDFETKSQYVEQKQDEILANEKALIKISEVLKMLLTNISIVELEVGANEEDLQRLERSVNALERDVVPGISWISQPANERALILKLFNQTSEVVEQLSTFLDDTAELERYAQLVRNSSSPYNAVLAMLDCQLRTLQKTEENLNELMEKTRVADMHLPMAISAKK